MKLASIRRDGATKAVRIDSTGGVEIPGVGDVGELLADPHWRTRAQEATGEHHDLGSLDFAPLVLRPDKIVCVGLNYRSHIAEAGQEPPQYPTLFAKFRSSLIGAHDDIELDSVIEKLDWEAELAVIIGAPVRHVSEDHAREAIAGFSVLNDVSARDWQRRSSQWLQGKTFESSTPLGPWMVTSDELDGRSGTISCHVNGEVVQDGDISDLLFGPTALVAYISSIVTLLPGDVIATGTPGGVGVARTPPRFLADGDLVTTRIEGIGECSNTCVRR